MRRLVEIDPETFYAREVDTRRLKREAQELKTYLLELNPRDDTVGLRRLIMPFCDQALAGTLDLPVDVGRKPILTSRIEDMGGTVPPGFEELYARFFNTATGVRAEVEAPVHKDGRVWAWMEFED
jgi:hypothetical protein